MSKLFIISEEEKDRILNLHESATNRQYLPEQQVKKGLPGDPYEYMEKDGKYYFRNLKKGGTKWVSANKNQSDVIKSKVFKNTATTNIKKDGDKVSKFTKPEFNVGVVKDTFKNQYYDTIVPREAKLALKTMEQTEKEIGKISKKTYKQLNKIKLNGQLKNDSFIIVNKDGAIASLFGPNYKFIGNSSITSGRVKDDKPVDINKLGYGEWRKQSIDYSKKTPTHPDSIKINKWIKSVKTLPGLINNDGYLVDNKYDEYLKDKKINEFPYSYEARKIMGKDITPGGLYKIGSGHNVKGYASSNTKNIFPLITMSGERLPNAIHGYAGKTRGDLINKFSQQDLNLSKEESRIGSGCVNVDEKLINLVNQYNPKYVVILPDSGQLVDVKIVSAETWSEKIASLGEKCTKSFISLFV